MAYSDLSWEDAATRMNAETGIRDASLLVEAFHDKNKVSPRGAASSSVLSEAAAASINHAATQVIMASQLLAAHLEEQLCVRGHLFLEEIGEYLEAIATGDEVQVLDALADMLYVTLGAAVAHDMPLAEAFLEVHRSNMTKERQASDEQGERIRDKGPNYEPPQLAEILEKHRS